MFEKMRAKKEIKRLRKNSVYAVKRMEEHICDDDPAEFKAWASINLIYLSLILEKCKALNEETA